MKNTLLIALFACFAVAGRAGTVTLSSVGPVTAGSTFDVNVQLTGAFAGLDPADILLGYGFSVNVSDPSVVIFTGETPGPFSNDLSNNPGIAPLVAGDFFLGLAPGDFSDPLILATLHFTALANGASTISVASNLTDLNQGLTFLLLPINQNIAASTAIVVSPEPSTLALAAFALAGVVAVRRSRVNMV